MTLVYGYMSIFFNYYIWLNVYFLCVNVHTKLNGFCMFLMCDLNLVYNHSVLLQMIQYAAYDVV